MSSNLSSRLINPGVPFRGRWAAVLSDGDRRSITSELQLPAAKELLDADGKLNLEVAAIARRPDGSVAAQFAQHVERRLSSSDAALIERDGLMYSNKLELRPGDYMVRFAVRDNLSGRMGAVSTRLHLE